MSALLEIDDLRVAFEDRGVRSVALGGISLEVGAGEVVGVVGETGCGKTLTGLSVLGLLPPTAEREGSITFDEMELTALPDEALRRLRGRSDQHGLPEPDDELQPGVHRRAGRWSRSRAGTSGSGAAARRPSSRETLREVGLPAPERVMRFYPHELSGGMLQRAMIAMAILCRPRLLIADEPTTALDVTVAQQILLLLREDPARARLRGPVHLARSRARRQISATGSPSSTPGAWSRPALPPSCSRRPRHPYTRALLDALPGRWRPREPLPTVPGGLPDPAGELRGCAFAERCPLAEERCFEVAPEPARVGPDRTSACHRWGSL